MTHTRSAVTSRIAHSTGVLAMATALSRVLGFALSLVIARRFGTQAEAQAFVVAFRLPNLFRDLVAEGAMASAVIPGTFAIASKRGAAGFGKAPGRLSMA